MIIIIISNNNNNNNNNNIISINYSGSVPCYSNFVPELNHVYPINQHRDRGAGMGGGGGRGACVPPPNILEL